MSFPIPFPPSPECEHVPEHRGRPPAAAEHPRLLRLVHRDAPRHRLPPRRLPRSLPCQEEQRRQVRRPGNVMLLIIPTGHGAPGNVANTFQNQEQEATHGRPDYDDQGGFSEYTQP